MQTLWDRRALEAAEAARLSPLAVRSTEATRRLELTGDDADDLRPAFQRDRDRVLHARAFRRLKHKTQVFVPHIADHPRTRLTHTLEVGQIARSLARALGLNEDLVEAVALAHDLGHTAFGHTGETALREILAGQNDQVPLPPEVVERVGTFKHNYQSVRVVDLLERRYAHPGLNLTDPVREGILKHTSWRRAFPFPLGDTTGLRLDEPCHLEGQAVAVADEIAQQTHDLEDGLRAGSVELEAVEPLAAPRRVIERHRAVWPEAPRWRRQDLLIRGLIHLFVGDVVAASAERIGRFAARHGIADRTGALAAPRPGQSTIALSPRLADELAEQKAFIYQFIINHPQVNRQDWRARRVVTGLYRAFWVNPLNLPTYVLLRAREELGLPYLRDVPLGSVAAEVAARYHPDPGFARLVADHVAGMSDRFALEEYRSLEIPGPEQRLLGDVR